MDEAAAAGILEGDGEETGSVQTVSPFWKAGADRDAKLREVFQSLDHNRNGRIEVEEMQVFALSLSGPMAASSQIV